MTAKSYNRALRAFTSFAFLIGAAFFNQTFAQTNEARIGRIRAITTETNRRVEAGLKDKSSGYHYAAWTIGGERDGQQWAAVGAMKTQSEFWFDREPNGGEEAVDARRLVRKIISTYASAGVPRSRSEYVFDDMGELVFAFESEADDAGKLIESRFYFHKDKLLRVTRGGKNIDRSYTESDRQAATNAAAEAKDLQNKFALIFGG